MNDGNRAINQEEASSPGDDGIGHFRLLLAFSTRDLTELSLRKMSHGRGCHHGGKRHITGWPTIFVPQFVSSLPIISQRWRVRDNYPLYRRCAT
ncbi:hypothetical protein KCP70_11240 [Salmonella enterica subsp. enterica]|nr:hypothetical protein KCP70_11240 [Salmonella enterica subsp. enterica]